MRTPIIWCLALGISSSVGCGDDPSDWEAGRPRIDALRFLQQSPQDPYGLVFSIEFTDSDGDLGRGSVLLRVDGDETAALDASELFQRQTPPLSEDATSGELEVIVKLTSNIKTDQRIEIGFVLEDAQGHRSNDPRVVLQALDPGSP